ncbi:signal peptidase II [Fenollaria sporofastidiosus]|uniref:signal peptidase II n=1 Tax=Fenollaria sporofastidiosus TaxID=2811778 RepID=UPI001C0049DA|nr:signal peptidase II [Fenollaria sporofastidiosus]
MIYLLIVVLAVALDQITKYFAKLYLEGRTAYEIIPNFFSFDYVENRGAAFGIMQGKHIFFYVVTFIAIAIILYIFITEFNTLAMYEKVFLSFFLAGILGNFIDRVFRGYVIDFISFKFGSYQYPCFNLADSYMCVIIVLFIGYYFYLKIKDKNAKKSN